MSSVVKKITDAGWKNPMVIQVDALSQNNWDDKFMQMYKQGLDMGKVTALKDQKTKLEKTFSENVKKTTALGEELYDYINRTQKLNCLSVHFRANSLMDFSLLFLIREEDYLSDKFDLVYKRAISKKKELNTTGFNVSISFLPNVESLESSKIVMDGYFISYHGKKEK